MKDYYLINEIAKLFDIGTDSLRYYEKIGLLQPLRDPDNGYRLYRLKDMYKLSIIRELRRFDYSTKEIKKYLADFSVDSTLRHLEQEATHLETQIQLLQQQQERIEKRAAILKQNRQIKNKSFVLRELPPRECVEISEHITRDEEMDFLIKKLHQQYEDKINNFADLTIGAFFAPDDLHQGIGNVFQAVFFILDNLEQTSDLTLPSGSYLSYYYRGSYQQNMTRIREMYDYCAENQLHPLGDPFELYLVDNRVTADEREFLTELQLPVRKK